MRVNIYRPNLQHFLAITIVGIALIFVGVAVTVTPVAADHTTEHCESQFPGGGPDGALRQSCIDNLTAPPAAEDEVGSPGPLGTTDDLGIPRVAADQSAIDNAVNAAALIAGGLATVFIVVGALKYTASAGDPDGTASAKNTIIAAVIGLLLVIFAYTIVNFVISNV